MCLNKFLCILLCLFFCSVNAEEKTIKIDEKYRQFFDSYCIDCHNAKKKKGKVRLDAEGFPFEIKTVKDADSWQHILDAIQSSEMPPEDDPQPTKEDKLEFLGMLSGKLVEARKALSDAGGKMTMRRLNRREYENTMKEFLGVPVDGSNLPSDHSAGSFDTDGGALFMSPDQIEQYLKIARNGVKRALHVDRLKEPLVERYQPETSINKFIQKKRDRYLSHYEDSQRFREAQKRGENADAKKFNLIDARDADIAESFYKRFFKTYDNYVNHPLSKTGSLLSLWHPYPSLKFTIGNYKRQITVPAKKAGGKPQKKNANGWFPEGLYKIRIRVSQTNEAQPERCFMDLGVIGKENDFKRLKTFHITAKQDSPQIVEAYVELSTNRRFALKEKSNDATARFKYSASNRKYKAGPAQAIWVDWIEWEGPLKIEKPVHIANVLQKINKSSTGEVVKGVLKKFATVAFRGEAISPDYLDKLVAIYKLEKANGKKPQEAIHEPLAIILASPSFLYITEPSGTLKAKKLTQSELANRLAYFLWSSAPDKKLLAAAKNYELQGEGLNTHVERMLKDPKISAFYRSFVYQWLSMERLSLFQFNAFKYPDFDETLKDAAADEVYETVKYLVDNNLGTQNLLKSDFIVINGLLANHYGIPNITGSEFRRVNLEKGSIRGGLTGMAAVAAMGSDGKHTSPVERGAWVLRKILNNPPPPAPANVPQLSRLEGKKLTVQQMLEAHQEEPQCSHCHKMIDPIGLGLENFDATGKWRTNDDLNKVKVKINPAGALYKGPSFKNYFELRDIFYSRADDFNRGLITNLVSYSLGRPSGFSDQSFIEELQKQMKKNNNSMRSLIHAIVQSKEFRTKK
ncbi:MAG: DUF1592 domain-containing protein [Lentisphaerales bacterium]|nr:DUF1592 domain-containing protein [Lentisphaerales bacterium]